MAIIDRNKKLIEDNHPRVFLGIDFPVRKSEGIEGYFASSSTTLDALKTDLICLLSTKQGERIFQPNLGLDLDKYLFEQITEESKNNIIESITSTINFYLPSINMLNLDILQSDISEVGTHTLKVVGKFSFANDSNLFDTFEIVVGA